MDKIRMLTEKEALALIYNQMLDQLLRAEIDLDFWTNMELDPTKAFDSNSRGNIAKKKQEMRFVVESKGKILKMIEARLQK